VLVPELHAAIPLERLQQAKEAGAILGDSVWKEFPWVSCNHGPDGHAHAMPVTSDPVEGILNRTWRPALSVTGAAGFPSIDSAGNVLRPKTTLKLSMRIPPTVDGEEATWALRRTLTEHPPYNAKVSFDADWGASGWNAPETAPWLNQALNDASRRVFGMDAAWVGEGGTIPFMNMLGERFPREFIWALGLIKKEAAVVNAELQILQFRGSTGSFLEPPIGKATFDVLKMAREGLLHGLRSAIQDTRKTGKPARKEGVIVKNNGSSREVDLQVFPLADANDTQFFLVLFEEPRRQIEPPAAKKGKKPIVRFNIEQILEFEARCLIDTRNN
jgi:hypothetical protein